MLLLLSVNAGPVLLLYKFQVLYMEDQQEHYFGFCGEVYAFDDGREAENPQIRESLNQALEGNQEKLLDDGVGEGLFTAGFDLKTSAYQFMYWNHNPQSYDGSDVQLQRNDTGFGQVSVQQIYYALLRIDDGSAHDKNVISLITASDGVVLFLDAQNFDDSSLKMQMAGIACEGIFNNARRLMV